MAISPGSPDEFGEIDGRCPTFSWSGVDAASGYEIVVYELGDGGPVSPPVLEVELPAGATSWTPASAECLKRASRYGWSVRQVGGPAPSAWSAELLFRVASGPSEAEILAAVELLRTAERRVGSEPVVHAAVPAAEAPRPAAASARAPVGRGAAPGLAPAAVAALTGELAATTGETYGLVGVSHSPQGAGAWLENTDPSGSDLRLGGPNPTDLTEAGLYRSSGSDLAFDFANLGGGAMALKVDGVDVVTTSTDADVLGSLACAAGEVAKVSGGVWICASDLDTVYTPGTGLWLAGTTLKVEFGTVQARVGGSCPAGESIRAIDAHGLVTCEVDDEASFTLGAGLILDEGVLKIDPEAFTTKITTLVTSGQSVPSLAIGDDGLPLIAFTFYNTGVPELRVAHCADVRCTSADIYPLDATGSTGLYPSLAIGSDGLGLISYYDASNQNLRVAHCNDTACTGATTWTLESTGNVGKYTSVAIGDDSLGVIAYLDQTNDYLKVAHCTNVTCSAATTTILASAEQANTSIAIGTDGFPLISYAEQGLRVVHCLSATCSSAIAYILDNGVATNGTSLTIGSDGLGLIAYVENLGDPSTGYESNLKIAHCLNQSCSIATRSTVDGYGVGEDVGYSPSITNGPDGRALISYFDFGYYSTYKTRVARCSNLICSSVSHTELGSYVGQQSSIAVGADGLPIVAFGEYSPDGLSVAHLGIGVP